MFTNNSRLLGRGQRLGRTILSPHAVATVVAGLTILGSSTAASAKALTFDSSPVTDAVAQINRTFDTHIVIKPGVNSDSLVSFTVPDVTEPGARLDAINDLANALKANYTKTFVITTSTADEPVPDPVLDAPTAPVVIRGTDAENAIKTIASIDDASVQFHSPVSGKVSFDEKQLSLSDAAREVARQTHTVWKAVYTISPRRAHEPSSDGARIIGYTSSGSPITELPTETFRPSVDPNAVQPEDKSADKTSDNKTADSTDKPKADAAQQGDQTATNPAPAYNPYGYSPYGGYYGGYGYGYPGYGYGGYGYGGYGGYGSYGGYGGGPMVIGGSAVTFGGSSAIGGYYTNRYSGPAGIGIGATVIGSGGGSPYGYGFGY